MKKYVFLLSIVCLFALNAFAQNPNFAGEWKLDTGKLDERRAAMIKSQTLTVEQTDKEIKATTTTERNAPPAGGGGQGGPPGGGGGRGMGGGFGGGDGTNTYKLDGSEVVTERETQLGKIPTKTTAKLKDGKLEISSSTTFTGPDGQERTNNVKSTWELSADGKTLTVKTTRNTPNGEMTTESVYTKKG
jgi:hypothetical protein